MFIQIRLLTMTVAIASMAAGASRFNGEKGARGHRTRLAASAEHTCAVMDDGTARCWGSNGNGELGDGTTTLRDSPVTVVNVNSAVSIATGFAHSCALLVNGLVSCSGQNLVGQLGNNGIFASPPDTPVTASIADVVSIAAGGFNTCAVKVDGTVWCWGNNDGRQLGNGVDNSTPSFAPVQALGLTNAVSVAVGTVHACALLADGSVRCWGTDNLGQLGNNTVANFSTVPVPTVALSPSHTVGAVDLVAGGNFTCALLSDSTVSCWGQNSQGQLGNGTTAGSAVPVLVSGISTAVAIGAGTNHACVILASGDVKCWGSNVVGQLGQPASNPSPFPMSAALSPHAVEIAGGDDHTCAIAIGGQIQCWGGNGFGQHGDGTTRGSGFSAAQGIGGTFLGRDISAGNQFSCATRGNGGVACWGAGAAGQLGNSTNLSSSTPVTVVGLTLVTAVSAGNGSHACSVDATGRAQCWGDNSRGQLGNGSLTPSNQPVFVSASGAQFTMISAGDLHTCGSVVGGRAMCWGANDRGQLGNGTNIDSAVPVLVAGVYNVVEIATGSGFACALVVDGTVHCWGDNTSFQLGDGGGQTQSSFPTGVFGATNIAAIAAGVSHACAVAASGSLSCWGANSRGQIGINSTTSAQVATLVSGITKVVAASPGAFFTCATRSTGGAACWGSDDSGELSAVDTASHLTPTTVFAGTHVLTGVKQIAAGTGLRRVLFNGGGVIPAEHTCTLLADGTIRCWGNNIQGEVGNGNTTNQPHPVAVNSFVANVSPAATLRNSRIADVTALIDCSAGAHAHITLTLEQASVTGTGNAEAQCTGNLLQVPLVVAAQGSQGWQTGGATAQVEAIIRIDGDISDDTHWTRQVTLSPSL